VYSWRGMFGLFNPRRRLQDLLARLELSKELNRLYRDAPGAAYLFARALVDARPLLDDESQSRRKKIRTVSAEIAQIEATRSDRADAGVSILALCFLKALLAAKEPIGYRFILESASMANGTGNSSPVTDFPRTMRPVARYWLSEVIAA